MDSSFSPKDEIWFLRVYRHISNAFYRVALGRKYGASKCAITMLTGETYYQSEERKVTTL
jgi:hypothetical protein